MVSVVDQSEFIVLFLLFLICGLVQDSFLGLVIFFNFSIAIYLLLSLD